MLQLETEHRLNWTAINDHHDDALVKTMNEIKWILPSEISKMSWWRNCFERLASDRRVRLATRKKALVGSMLRKLDLVKDVNGDLLCLYLCH